MRSRLGVSWWRTGLSLVLATGVCGATLRAAAHAPEPRGVAVANDAGALAVALPGFGLVVRASEDQPFAYLCNALLGDAQSSEVPSLGFVQDGSLLVGTRAGLRVVGSDGCPVAAAEELGRAEIVAMATSPDTQVAYAVVAGERPGVWRSDDGGRHWQRGAELARAASVTALAVREHEPAQLVLSETTSTGSVVWESHDGGATLTAYPNELDLTLLHAGSRATRYLWARARDAGTVGNRGWALLRAERPEGPWQTQHHVAYFGGFVAQAVQGAAWISVGDEIGGVYRSQDDGESFRRLAPEVPVACLGLRRGRLWACTPETLQQPALRSLGESEGFEEVLRLPAVERLVACDAELEVERVCAAAWVEWQRDVLGRTLGAPDASVADAGGTAEATDAAQAPAGEDSGLGHPDEDAAVATDASSVRWDVGPKPRDPMEPTAQRASGCSALPGPETSPLAHVVLAAWCLLAGHLFARRRGHCAP